MGNEQWAMGNEQSTCCFSQLFLKFSFVNYILPTLNCQLPIANCKLPTANCFCQLPTANYLCAMKILMVCLGNICRSPLAEGILQHKANAAGLNWIVESAGTNGYHDGEPPHSLSIKVALQNGIDIKNQRSRKFKAADFERYDKIYAMAEDVVDDMKHIAREKFDNKKVSLLLNELYPGKNKAVPDPWSGPEKGYYEVYDLIDRACEKVVSREPSVLSGET
jgi:protein-tyrosine phosphatase